MPAAPIEGTLGEALGTLGLQHLAAGLPADATLDSCRARLTADRPAFLDWLRQHGFAKVGERQKVANALGKGARALSGPADDSSLDAEVGRLLARGAREAAMELLKERGVRTLGERQRLVSAHLQRAGGASSAPALTPAEEAERAIAAGEVAFVTLTNSGYLAYTANCLTSLDVVGERDVPLTVYCADRASYERLQSAEALRSLRAPTVVHMDEDAHAAFCAWKEKGWPRLMWLKCEVCNHL